MRSLHHVPDPSSAFPELARVVREHVWIAEPLPEGEFFELLRPVDDETEVRAAAQRAIAEQDGFDRVETIEYDVTLPIPTFEALRERVLAADPDARRSASPSSRTNCARGSRPATTSCRCGRTCCALPAGEHELAGALELARVDRPSASSAATASCLARQQPVDDPLLAVPGQPRLGGVAHPFR